METQGLMRHKRIKNLIVGGALISAFFITGASAYNQEYTHPALTDEIVDFRRRPGHEADEPLL